MIVAEGEDWKNVAIPVAGAPASAAAVATPVSIPATKPKLPAEPQ